MIRILCTLAAAFLLVSTTAQAQQVAQAQTAQIPEQVLVTGSLIRGTAAVGVPVTSVGVGDCQTREYLLVRLGKEFAHR